MNMALIQSNTGIIFVVQHILNSEISIDVNAI